MNSKTGKGVCGENEIKMAELGISSTPHDL